MGRVDTSRNENIPEVHIFNSARIVYIGVQSDQEKAWRRLTKNKKDRKMKKRKQKFTLSTKYKKVNV
jgi:hypothetical protein